MSQKMKKFDITVMDTTSDRFKYIKPVTSMDTFQGMSKDFHEDGLFSTSIFGKVGTPDRNTRMSFINVKIGVLDPKIYYLICSLKQLYKNIIAGTVYAKWDAKEKDFVKSTNIDGSTGFNFFLQHWKEIRFVKNDSQTRTDAITVVNKYKNIALTSKIMVIPAGIRDVEIDNNEEITKHEINDFYVKLLSVANSLPDSGSLDTPLTDRSRLTLQLTFCELYDYLSKLTGQEKKSFMRRKWGSRRVKYGSRNVIVALPSLPSKLGDKRVIRYNETGIGLYQASAVYSPVLVNKLLEGYLIKCKNPVDGVMNLINSKTLIREEVSLKPKQIDKWLTPTGLFKTIDSLSDQHIRNMPIMVGDHYLGLVYKDDKYFRLLNDINDLAESNLKIENVHPITYSELFYIHGYAWYQEYPATVTRYPINGYRSIYPTIPHVLTTNRNFELIPLDENLNPMEGITAPHYPDTTDDNWFDAMVPASSRLVGLGADFDGDMVNFNPIFSDESRLAVKKYLNSKAAYLDSAGKLLNNPFHETLERILYSLTGDVK